MPNKSHIFQLDDDRDPWIRQPKETLKAYDCFRTYLFQPYGSIAPDGSMRVPTGRSMEDVGKMYGTCRGVYERWARQWGWTQRAAAYDQHLNEGWHPASPLPCQLY